MKRVYTGRPEKMIRKLWKKLSAFALAALVMIGCMGAVPTWADETTDSVNLENEMDSVRILATADTDVAEEADTGTAEETDTGTAEETDTDVTEEADTTSADTVISQETVSTDASWPAGPEISSPSAIVMEANTGTVLYEKNADEQHYPASITKIMTTLLAIENSSMDEIVTFSATAVYENEGDTSHIARDVDEQMTMEQCLYATMLESANECAYAVAEHIGGDCQTFVDMMNAKAEELGCTNTHFNNPNGLPDETHVTTCRDMALIAKAAIENPTFRQITGTVRYTIPPTNKHDTETLLNNHHQMISNYKGSKYLYDGCIGGKTGYTDAARNTLVTYAERDGMLLICVIMNSVSTKYEDTTALFDYCFANYQIYNVSQNETRFADSGTNTYSLFGEAEAFAELDSEAKIILPATADFSDTQTEISYEDISGDVVGTLVYSYGGRICGTADVVMTGASGATYEFGEATESSEEDSAEAEMVSDGSDDSDGAEKTSFWDKLQKKRILLKILIGVVIVVVAMFAVIFLYNNIRRYIRRKRRRRDRRYKVIKENRKWRKRRGRR